MSVVGGHSIDDAEPKLGYAVVGLVHPGRIWRNVGARPGDALVLTKPLGTGIISTAIKQAKAPERAVTAALRSMATLNRSAAEAAADGAGPRGDGRHGVRAPRPPPGDDPGLEGARRGSMRRGSRSFPDVVALAEAGLVPGGTAAEPPRGGGDGASGTRASPSRSDS